MKQSVGLRGIVFAPTLDVAPHGDYLSLSTGQ